MIITAHNQNMLQTRDSTQEPVLSNIFPSPFLFALSVGHKFAVSSSHARTHIADSAAWRDFIFYTSQKLTMLIYHMSNRIIQ